MEAANTVDETSTEKKLGPVTIHVDYAKSILGIVKVIIVALSMLAFICVTAGDWAYCYNWGPQRFFQFVSMSAFWATLFLYFIYLVGLDKVILFINWQLTELVWCGVYGAFYLISSAILAAKTCYSGSMAAGAVFGFFVMIAFGVDAFFMFQEFRQRVVLSDSSRQPAPEYSPDEKY